LWASSGVEMTREPRELANPGAGGPPPDAPPVLPFFPGFACGASGQWRFLRRPARARMAASAGSEVWSLTNVLIVTTSGNASLITHAHEREPMSNRSDSGMWNWAGLRLYGCGSFPGAAQIIPSGGSVFHLICGWLYCPLCRVLPHQGDRPGCQSHVSVDLPG